MADYWCRIVVCCAVEHVGVDSGLPSAVRLVRVGPVPRGSALWQKHAAGGEPELRQPVHGPLPEAVGHRHRRAFYLRCQRVSPQADSTSLQADSGSDVRAQCDQELLCSSCQPAASHSLTVSLSNLQNMRERLKHQNKLYFLLHPDWLCPPPGAAGAFRSRKALGTFWAALPSSWLSCCSGTSASSSSTVSFSCENFKPVERDGQHVPEFKWRQVLNRRKRDDCW